MTNVSEPDSLSRRTLLEITATGSVATSLAGCSASGEDTGGVASGSVDFDGWFDDVSNYDGVRDATGRSEVEITVGAKTNRGNFGFAPAAVTVSPNTTVVWKWNGKGSIHNVVADDGTFESETMNGAGETFERTFESEGTYKYYCAPHREMGMKGAIVVE